MTRAYEFDIRVSAKSRALTRLFISSVFATGLIISGLYLLPRFTVWDSLASALATGDGWAFLGLIMVAFGIYAGVKVAVFAIKSLGKSGYWHFRLADGHLSWDVPDHMHGEEIGFRSALSEISSIECRTIERWEQANIREYWLHFHDRYSIQLQSYSGVSLSWLAFQIRDAGIEYRDTTIEG
ncbi:hypothetical protein [Erythrobacter ani]|uniref:YcxB-like protein domain-containing protein n=1 Tax=Erythrobacter ani TaxID=2827235 RepID=A0ABS6SNU5_9SPHN|nr:hypothetical protein [Erythrobacter ani]MBV7266696.1 hypothetical protein [Erythrobacter ani]